MLEILNERLSLTDNNKDNKQILLERAELELRLALQEVCSSAMKGIFTNINSQATIDSYKNDITTFFNVDHIEEITIDMIRNTTVQDANNWCATMFNHGEGLAKNTINRRMEALKSFFDKLYVYNKQLLQIPVYSPLGEFGGYTFQNPFDRKNGAVRLPVDETDYTQARTLSDEEVQKMLNYWKTDNTITGYRNFIMILLLYTTGIRRDELRKITLGDFIKPNNQNATYVRITGKGGKSRYISVPTGLKSIIGKYLVMRGLNFQDTDAPLFVGHGNRATANSFMTNTTISRIINKTAKECGIESERVSTHSFRHTFISNCREQGKSFDTIADLVGHSSVSTTKRYDHSYSYLNETPSEEMFDNIIQGVC